MNKSVLMISPFFSPNTGGVETFLDDFVVYLNKKDCNVDVITYQPLTTNTKAPIYEYKNNRIFRIPWIKFNLFYKLEKYPLFQLLYLGSGIGICSLLYFIFGKGKDIKVVNCHGLAAGFVGYILSFIVRRHFVLNLHTNYRFSKQSLVGRFVIHMIERFNKVVVISLSCKTNLETLGVAGNKIFSYHNWVDEKLFMLRDKQLCREKLNWENNAFYALFVGRFSPEKGIFDLLEAIPLIKNDIKLMIIGGGMGENKVKVSSQNDNVYYLGRKTAVELAVFFNAADILVYAPVDEDYLGRVAISALNCGLPIMVPRQSYYMGKKQNVSLEISSQIGRFFDNHINGFSEELNKIYRDRYKNLFSRDKCRQYAQGYYGEEINGKILFDNIKG